MDVTDKTFEAEVIKKSSETPVLVDFWASWCGPCKQLGPVIAKVVAEYKGKVILAKAETDKNEDAAGKYSVMSIPSVKLFKDGKIVADFTGALSEDKIKEFLDKNL